MQSPPHEPRTTQLSVVASQLDQPTVLLEKVVQLKLQQRISPKSLAQVTSQPQLRGAWYRRVHNSNAHLGADLPLEESFSQSPVFSSSDDFDASPYGKSSNNGHTTSTHTIKGSKIQSKHPPRNSK
ncbi:hypothetical protein OESDEN_05996 [Oesophagostomum dentatum]|uniref:Uncharacterized protein n=1 Tax=Oesophagostomum dentatum TaxID=61180 RepID=A0A0B1TA14_OESDE|nr:hypothetical protein OESDEN_05996 [Oesophagostomum dentatum]